MKVSSIHLTRFKRFKDLTIEDIPETSKLVVIAGPNGSGKSSLFDAFHRWVWESRQASLRSDDDRYYARAADQPSNSPRLSMNDVAIKFHGKENLTWNSAESKKAIYVRTAYRNDPEFQLSQLRRQGYQVDESHFQRIIHNDATVSRNYERLASQGLADLYGGGATTFDEYVENSIGNIRDAILKLFPDLRLRGLGDPLVEGTFRFDKGTSSGFMYMNLSAGEKSAFDLILDILIKRREYNDTVFCIDEPEAHMNTRLQGGLLEELLKCVPDNSQLWIATHSIGMMRRARDMYIEAPEEVTFIDFHNKDFDKPQVLTPTKPNRAFWVNALDTALADITNLVAPERVVICEGTPKSTGHTNAEHDSRCYDIIFANEVPDAKFLAGGNSSDVETDRLALMQAIEALVKGTNVIRLIDQDDRSPQQIGDLKEQGVRVLRRRNIECYLFDDEVLSALCEKESKSAKVDDLLRAKEDALANVLPKNDVKKAAGGIYNSAKNILDLKQPGNNWKFFARDILSPLLQPGMTVYEELKEDIFGSN